MSISNKLKLLRNDCTQELLEPFSVDSIERHKLLASLLSLKKFSHTSNWEQCQADHATNGYATYE